MTDAQAQELIAVVRATLLPLIQGHPERDDLLGEGILKAYQAVAALPPESPWRWTTVAAKAAQWQAGEYLRQRRSGRLTSQRAAEIRPERLDSVPLELLPADDGGIAAADARLQLWLWRVNLTARQRQVVHQVHWEGQNFNEAAKALGIVGKTAGQIYAIALRKYRQSGNLEPAPGPRRCRQCRRPLAGSSQRRQFCSSKCKSRYQDYRRPSRSQRYAAREQQP